MPDRTAPTDHPVHPILASRWSPRAFGARSLTGEAIASLFEAARWSPSANNLQPWAFIYTVRDTPEFGLLCGCLKDTNAVWARHAALLGLALERSARPDGSPNGHARYDLGQAVAHLTFQASALGIRIHQMAGFDPDRARTTLGIPQGLLPVTAFAAGYPGEAPDLPAAIREKDQAPRTRHPASTFVHAGRWPDRVA